MAFRLIPRDEKFFDDFVADDDVWRLKLAADANSIVWTSGPAEELSIQTSEPDAGLWLRLKLFFLGLLVPEKLL